MNRQNGVARLGLAIAATVYLVSRRSCNLRVQNDPKTPAHT